MKKTGKTRVWFATVIVSTAALFVGGAGAAYPDHRITAIVPFAPGGSSDLLGRIFSQSLGTALHQTVVVENKPGAAANVGMGVAAQSKPDGYTILFTGPAATQNPALYQNMPYDPLRDLIPVALLAQGPYVICVNVAKIPVKTLPNLVALIKKNPGKYNGAAGGIVSRLTLERFRRENGLDIVVIPYASAGVAATSLMTGETDMVIVDSAPLGPGIASGKLRALAVTSDKRLPTMPDVPTTAEAGFPAFQDAAQFGAYLPAATPPDIVAKLHDVLNNAAAEPDIARQLATLGFTPIQETQAEFATFYKSEIDKWKSLVKEAKIPFMD